MALSLRELLAKRPVDQAAVERHKARMLADIESYGQQVAVGQIQPRITPVDMLPRPRQADHD